jgi:hypothetical protein
MEHIKYKIELLKKSTSKCSFINPYHTWLALNSRSQRDSLTRFGGMFFLCHSIDLKFVHMRSVFVRF